MAKRYCNGCDAAKPLRDFGKNKYGPNGLQWLCRNCINTASRAKHAANPEIGRAADKRWQAKHPEQVRANVARWQQANPTKVKHNSRNGHLKHKFGITVEIYEQLLEDQNGECAICHNPPRAKRLSVDHDHATGQIRGLLCDFCNVGIARLQDNIEILQAAISYLEAPPAAAHKLIVPNPKNNRGPDSPDPSPQASEQAQSEYDSAALESV